MSGVCTGLDFRIHSIDVNIIVCNLIIKFVFFYWFNCAAIHYCFFPVSISRAHKLSLNGRHLTFLPKKEKQKETFKQHLCQLIRWLWQLMLNHLPNLLTMLTMWHVMNSMCYVPRKRCQLKMLVFHFRWCRAIKQLFDHQLASMTERTIMMRWLVIEVSKTNKKSHQINDKNKKKPTSDRITLTKIGFIVWMVFIWFGCVVIVYVPGIVIPCNVVIGLFFSLNFIKTFFIFCSMNSGTLKPVNSFNLEFGRRRYSSVWAIFDTSSKTNNNMRYVRCDGDNKRCWINQSLSCASVKYRINSGCWFIKRSRSK